MRMDLQEVRGEEAIDILTEHDQIFSFFVEVFVERDRDLPCLLEEILETSPFLKLQILQDGRFRANYK